MAKGQPLDMVRELVEAFEHNGQVNAYLVGTLPPLLWHAPPPRRGRTIGAIVAHIQSVRRTFAKLGGAEPVPASLDRLRSTQAEAQRALRQGNDVLTGLFRESLARGEARVRGMPRRSVNMMVYLMQHDAHHRGQICALARALDHAFSSEDVMRIWGWKKLP